MRIAVVVETFPTISETFIVNQILGYLNAGHDVFILAYHRGPDSALHESILDNDLLKHVFYFKSYKKGKFKFILRFALKLITQLKFVNFLTLFELFFKLLKKSKYRLSMLEHMQWFVLNKRFDIVHAHFGPIANRILILKSFKTLKHTKVFTSFHGYDLRPDEIRYNRQRYKDLFTRGDGFIVNTPYLRSILEMVKGNLDRVYTIPVGLDINKFKPEGIKRIPYSLLFCGRLIEFKAPDLAIKIAHFIKLKKIDVRLTIIGEGVLESKLKELCLELDMKNHVDFIGACKQENVHYHMNRNQILIMPGVYDSVTGRAETQGLVIQEAQAMEMPVLVSDVGGMKYGLISGKTGYVLPEHDIEEFANCALNLFKNDKLRDQMGQDARVFIKENYSIELVTQQHLDVFCAGKIKRAD